MFRIMIKYYMIAWSLICDCVKWIIQIWQVVMIECQGSCMLLATEWHTSPWWLSLAQTWNTAQKWCVLSCGSTLSYNREHTPLVYLANNLVIIRKCFNLIFACLVPYLCECWNDKEPLSCLLLKPQALKYHAMLE